MPTLKEFKFNCPGCGQHILANTQWIGRRINCPSCNSRIMVPPLAKEPKKEAAVVPPPSRAQSKSPERLSPGSSPDKGAGTGITTGGVTGTRGQERQAVKKSPTKELKKDAAVMPPTSEASSRPAGSLMPKAVRGDQGGAETAPPSTVPAPVKEARAVNRLPAQQTEEDVSAPWPSKPAGPGTPGGRLRVELPPESAASGTGLTPVSLSVPKEAELKKTAATPGQAGSGVAGDEAKSPEAARIAVLSPGVKLDMVRAVRRRIADESAWLPGKVKGAAAYAAKMQEGEVALLEVGSPEATRFSLIGAFLLEMETRRVVKTAVGRKRFLDEEIPEAIREVLLDQMSDEEREHAAESLAGRELETIAHGQCLAALDRLEERYLQRAEQLQIEKAKGSLGNVRLPNLVKKLEKKVGLSPEEVATALYHEIMDLRRRLESLERRLMRERQVPTNEN